MGNNSKKQKANDNVDRDLHGHACVICILKNRATDLEKLLESDISLHGFRYYQPKYYSEMTLLQVAAWHGDYEQSEHR